MRFNVSLAAVVVVVVVTVVDEVKQGVFMTLPNILGKDVVLVAATGVDTDDNGVESTIDVVGSVTMAVVDEFFATSSMTSSICDRDVAVVDGFVTVGFSPGRFGDETIFDTILIRSFGCVGVVTTLLVVGVDVIVVVCRDC